MITSKMACKIALKLPDVDQKDHFGSDAFFAHKRTFATVWHEDNEVNLRLPLSLQKFFVKKDPQAFVAIDNGWGRQGWTTCRLADVSKELFLEGITAAWEHSKVKTKSAAKPRKKAKTSASRKLTKTSTTKRKKTP